MVVGSTDISVLPNVPFTEWLGTRRYVAQPDYHNMQQEMRFSAIPWMSDGQYGCGWSKPWPSLCYLPDLGAAGKLEGPNMPQNSAPVTWPGMENKRKRLRASNPNNFECIILDSITKLWEEKKGSLHPAGLRT